MIDPRKTHKFNPEKCSHCAEHQRNTDARIKGPIPISELERIRTAAETKLANLGYYRLTTSDGRETFIPIGEPRVRWPR